MEILLNFLFLVLCYNYSGICAINLFDHNVLFFDAREGGVILLSEFVEGLQQLGWVLFCPVLQLVGVANISLSLSVSNNG